MDTLQRVCRTAYTFRHNRQATKLAIFPESIPTLSATFTAPLLFLDKFAILTTFALRSATPGLSF